ncbi:hypothetical protein MVEN_00852400 [Mycena venus]|uniref:F-box domain-containing protein n=1 Tax=Mycena venus TaxID=2733690 RepID=A0A8H6YG21_9AGAR|nr:hypothetical protein MVEN_00852400 [Mycena venus]
MSSDTTGTPLESPFRKHFNTNYVPTDADIECIRTHLVPHEAELARLEKLIHELTTQRDRVKNYIAPHKALISHPRRLPHDILEEIFLDCLPTHRNAVMSATEAPLLLGRICSAWRSFVFATPRLWASLHIPLAFVTRSETMTAAMVEWLERSAPLPLALSVTAGWDNPANEAVLNLLLGMCHRWGELHVSGMRSLDFFLLADVHAPSLTEVRIVFADGIAPHNAPDILSSSLFRSMKTGRISISGDQLDSLVPSTPFTWDHLTHLTLHWSDRAGRHLSSHSAYQLLEGV